jgi:tRNA (cytidine/uridine-2'-O-)-methyltransferase
MLENVHVVFVEPEIHWNTGNAGRTCVAVGAKLHLVEPLGFSLDVREVRRAGLDYWPKVNPTVWRDWDTFEAEMEALGEPFFISPDGERTFWEVDYPERAVLVFGKESVGLPRRVRAKHRAKLIGIPILPDSVRSLNLSTCVGIVLYEILRQSRARAASGS